VTLETLETLERKSSSIVPVRQTSVQATDEPRSDWRAGRGERTPNDSVSGRREGHDESTSVLPRPA